MTLNLRKGLWKDKDTGDLARDVAKSFKGVVHGRINEFDAPYTEPFYVSAPHEPKGLLCIRLRNVTGRAETPIATGALCHFVWEGSKKRCRIDSIDGMSPGTAIYRFTFLMVG